MTRYRETPNPLTLHLRLFSTDTLPRSDLSVCSGGTLHPLLGTALGLFATSHAFLYGGNFPQSVSYSALPLSLVVAPTTSLNGIGAARFVSFQFLLLFVDGFALVNLLFRLFKSQIGGVSLTGIDRGFRPLVDPSASRTSCRRTRNSLPSRIEPLYNALRFRLLLIPSVESRPLEYNILPDLEKLVELRNDRVVFGFVVGAGVSRVEDSFCFLAETVQ